MAKLTKAESKLHLQAVELLKKDVLTIEEKIFVFENWQESATHHNTIAGAFFTPYDMALDFALEVPRSPQRVTRVIDFCAGIGVLAFTIWERERLACEYGIVQPLEIFCVEASAEYVAIGKKLLPEATWIHGSVFDPEVMNSLGYFDYAVSNPPFGRVMSETQTSRYRGTEFEYKVIDLASNLADQGAFIIPQSSAPYSYSGSEFYSDDTPPPAKYSKFHQETGITLSTNIGIDTTIYKGWRGVKPKVEIVNADFRAHCLQNQN